MGDREARGREAVRSLYLSVAHSQSTRGVTVLFTPGDRLLGLDLRLNVTDVALEFLLGVLDLRHSLLVLLALIVFGDDEIRAQQKRAGRRFRRADAAGVAGAAGKDVCAQGRGAAGPIRGRRRSRAACSRPGRPE